MGREHILKLLEDTPEFIDSPVEMNEANFPINIYNGQFLIEHEKSQIKVDGYISYKWLPDSGAYFYGSIQTNEVNIYELRDVNDLKIIVDDIELGSGFIISANFGTSKTDISIKGVLSRKAVLGDNSVSVNKIRFSIPNFKEFYGETIKRITEENIYNSNSRFVLENAKYTITIDKCYNYKELYQSLDENGGYIILYGGELTSKKGLLTFDNSKNIFHCLDIFLSFLNGRTTSTLFLHGIYDDQILWKDYTNQRNKSYKYVQTWSHSDSKNHNKLWEKFSDLWKNEDDKNFLITLINWYVETNGNTDFPEGSIVMAQTALELLYNWWIIEHKKLIIGKDTENINAANKIRLLLSQLNIPYNAPESFISLQKYIKDNKFVDAPEAVVQIRNAIVHSQEEKRKKLNAIDDRVIYEALQLCIWYIEMGLLCILEFSDYYHNRCSIGRNEIEYVPWVKKRNGSETI